MPKALAVLAGKPLLHWPVAAAARARHVSRVVIAAPPGCIEQALEIARAAAGGQAEVATVEGGAERAESVSHALAAVTTPLVAVHDAARPLVASEAFDSLAEIVAESGVDGAILATPVFDTVKRAGDLSHPHPAIAGTVDRQGLWAAQTPQVFVTEALRRAYDEAGPRAPEATDEATLIEWAGGEVRLVPGRGPNFKITSPEDIALAEAMLGDGI